MQCARLSTKLNKIAKIMHIVGNCLYGAFGVNGVFALIFGAVRFSRNY